MGVAAAAAFSAQFRVGKRSGMVGDQRGVVLGSMYRPTSMLSEVLPQ